MRQEVTFRQDAAAPPPIAYSSARWRGEKKEDALPLSSPPFIFFSFTPSTPQFQARGCVSERRKKVQGGAAGRALLSFSSRTRGYDDSFSGRERALSRPEPTRS